MSTKIKNSLFDSATQQANGSTDPNSHQILFETADPGRSGVKIRLLNNIGVGACLCTIFLIVGSVSAQSPPYGIRMLDGYKYKGRDPLGVLSGTGIIFKDKGLLIEFEKGMSTCCAADPSKMVRYAWFKEQTIDGRKVYLALIKKGLKTGWEPDRPRDKQLGSILLVSYPGEGLFRSNGINFVAEILSDEELAEALLMILSYDPGAEPPAAASPEPDYDGHGGKQGGGEGVRGKVNPVSGLRNAIRA